MKKTINNVYDFQDLDNAIRGIVEDTAQPVAFKVLASDWKGEPVEVVFFAKIHEETGWVGYNETVKSTRRNAYRPDLLYFCDIVSEYGYGFTVVKA